MATTWPTGITILDALSGKGGSGGLVQAIYDRLMCVMARGFEVHFADADTLATSGSPHTWGGPITLRVPPYLTSGRKLRYTFRLKSGNAAQTAYARLQEADGPTNGTTVSVAGTTWGFVTSEITIPDGTWAGAYKRFQMQLWSSSASYRAYFSRQRCLAPMRGGE